LVAYRTITTIIPTVPLEPIRRPNPMLPNKPHKKMHFGGAQGFHTMEFIELEVIPSSYNL
jgi:hypothetical protein